MQSLALLLIGYSLFSALLLALTHFRRDNYDGQASIRRAGIALIAALTGLQFAHWGWLHLDRPWTDSAAYRMLLFSIAPAFHRFSHPLLQPNPDVRLRAKHFVHALPVVAAPWLTTSIALPLAFAIGSSYLIALGRDLYRLRTQREQFAHEILLLGAVLAIAVGVAVLGLLQARLPEKLFYVLYSVAIGLAFLLVQFALTLRPQLAADVTEATKTAYANSTLARVDSDAKLARLDELMRYDRAYEDSELSLTTLAERIGLSSHQLSELLNTRLGKGFSRYLREQRVAAAKAMLLAEPSASVLSVGLSVGFSTQSSFYDAFREVVGMTPGQYRKLGRITPMSGKSPV